MSKHRLINPARRRAAILLAAVPFGLAVAATPASAGTSPKTPAPPAAPPMIVEEEHCNGIAACVDVIDDVGVDSLLKVVDTADVALS